VAPNADWSCNKGPQHPSPTLAHTSDQVELPKPQQTNPRQNTVCMN